MSTNNSYVKARNQLTSAWMVIVLQVLFGILLPLSLIIIVSYWAKVDFVLAYRELFKSEVIPLFICCLISNRISILLFASRQKIGIGNIIIRGLIAFQGAGFVSFVASVLIFLTESTLNEGILNIVLIIIWMLLGFIEPIVAIFKLPKLHKQYKLNKVYKEAERRQKQVERGRVDYSGYVKGIFRDAAARKSDEHNAEDSYYDKYEDVSYYDKLLRDYGYSYSYGGYGYSYDSYYDAGDDYFYT